VLYGLRLQKPVGNKGTDLCYLLGKFFFSRSFPTPSQFATSQVCLCSFIDRRYADVTVLQPCLPMSPNQRPPSRLLRPQFRHQVGLPILPLRILDKIGRNIPSSFFFWSIPSFHANVVALFVPNSPGQRGTHWGTGDSRGAGCGTEPAGSPLTTFRCPCHVPMCHMTHLGIGC
jgi:hypothetical protein